jgi:uncharacterized damage-inducible protein DinB
LERTPRVMSALLDGLSSDWIRATEGADSWSAYDIAGHMVIGEKTDWLARTRIILTEGESQPFEPFDRFLQFEHAGDSPIGDILDEFARLRQRNLTALRQLLADDPDFSKTGLHPSFGEVTLSELLSAWVVHDLGHIAQLARVLAKRYTADVGPWIDFLPVLTDRTSKS